MMADILQLPLPPPQKPEAEEPSDLLSGLPERESDHKEIARGQRAIRDVLRTLERWRDRESRPDGH